MEQMTKPGKTWWTTVKDISVEININIDNETLMTMTKPQWAQEVNRKITQLDSIEYDHWRSKSKKCNLMKSTSKMQPYLNEMGKDEAETFLLERLGMTKVKGNYRNMHNDTKCRFCETEEETTIHILKCKLQPKATQGGHTCCFLPTTGSRPYYPFRKMSF